MGLSQILYMRSSGTMKIQWSSKVEELLDLHTLSPDTLPQPCCICYLCFIGMKEVDVDIKSASDTVGDW